VACGLKGCYLTPALPLPPELGQPDARALFTNREGFDAFVLSEREVAAMLRRQELQMLDQAPIVERALNRLMADDEPELRLQA